MREQVSEVGECKGQDSRGECVCVCVCMCVCVCLCVCPVCVKLLQSCLILCDPLDCSLPGSWVHDIFQVRILQWAALLQGIFQTQGLNLRLLHCRWILYR